MRDRMTGMIGELGQLLDATDPLWLAFGLNEPGTTNLPDSADALVLTAGPAGTVLLHWTPGSRHAQPGASTHRGRGSRPETTLPGLPSGKTVQYYIVSANDASQAAPSDTVQIVVP